MKKELPSAIDNANQNYDWESIKPLKQYLSIKSIICTPYCYIPYKREGFVMFVETELALGQSFNNS